MKDDIKFKAITFIENNDKLNGHYFFNTTLPEALQKMKNQEIDPVKNIKMNIAVYY